MKIIVLFAAFLLFSISINAQELDSLNIPHEDSIARQLSQAHLLLRRSDSILLVDSIEKLLLLKQMESLKTYEKRKKQALELKLTQLLQHDSLRREKLAREIDSLRNITQGYPVIPYRDTLFFIYSKLGSFSAKERAAQITSRLQQVQREFVVLLDSIYLISHENSAEVMYQSQTLITLNETDELWFGQSLDSLANQYKTAIEQNIIQYKQNRSVLNILKQIGLSLLIVLVQILLIRLVNYLFRTRFDVYLRSKQGIWFKEIKIKNYQMLDAQRLTDFVLVLSTGLRYFINIVQLFITVPMIFSVFPPTRKLAETLFRYVWAPVEQIGRYLIGYIPNLITIIVIVILFRYLIKFLAFLSREVAAGKLKIPGFYTEWAKPTFNILRFLIYAFMFVVIFPYLPGSDSNVFKGVSVFIGVIFSLGSTSVIGNMVAGLVITYMRPFQLGDRIKIGEIVGDVIEKTAFVTRLKTPKKEIITIPNSHILSSQVVNYSTTKKSEGVLLYSTVTIGYDVPWRQVHQLLKEAAVKTQWVEQEPEPFVLQTSLDDFYVSYQVNLLTRHPEQQPKIYSELHQNIQDAFHEAGVEIMSPHFRGFRDGNNPNIPQEYLKKKGNTPPENI